MTARSAADGEVRTSPCRRPHVRRAGGCWFTEWAAGRIGYITPDGKITEYDLPTPSSEPHGLTVGWDGTVHVALENAGLARLERA
jgi:virginiamycin B lyase